MQYLDLDDQCTIIGVGGEKLVLPSKIKGVTNHWTGLLTGTIAFDVLISLQGATRGLRS